MRTFAQVVLAEFLQTIYSGGMCRKERRLGRPRLPDEQRKEVVNFRITGAAKRRLAALASERGVPSSKLIESAIMRYLFTEGRGR